MASALPTAAHQLRQAMPRAAFSFRGYNTTNLGRTHELWEVPAYQPVLERWLELGSQVCHDAHGLTTDLVARVVGQREPDLDHYAESVALIMAVEFAQIELLETIHAIEYRKARLSFGYSLGELTAVAASQIISPAEAMEVPVALAHDCAALAHDVRMGIVFSRTEAVDEHKVIRLCEEITAERQGVIGISAVLSPNTYLVLGQRDTLARFRAEMGSVLGKSAHLKRDPNLWPPLHTPIVRQRHIPDRASVMMEKMSPRPGLESPTLFSLATGTASYHHIPAREILRRWIDHPQRLWDAVMFTLKEDVDLIIHVGPAPNVVPATFSRLSDNVRQQLARMSLSGLGMRAVSNLVNRRWLANLLPNRAALLRAPSIRQLNLEDWLIDNAPK
jgi:[acyl-carrier-protein] S-malonyltransferase